MKKIKRFLLSTRFKPKCLTFSILCLLIVGLLLNFYLKITVNNNQREEFSKIVKNLNIKTVHSKIYVNNNISNSKESQIGIENKNDDFPNEFDSKTLKKKHFYAIEANGFSNEVIKCDSNLEIELIKGKINSISIKTK
jgi:hypothetical protein